MNLIDLKMNCSKLRNNYGLLNLNGKLKKDDSINIQGFLRSRMLIIWNFKYDRN